MLEDGYQPYGRPGGGAPGVSGSYSTSLLFWVQSFNHVVLEIPLSLKF